VYKVNGRYWGLNEIHTKILGHNLLSFGKSIRHGKKDTGSVEETQYGVSPKILVHTVIL
jgi:hypothetical protein